MTSQPPHPPSRKPGLMIAVAAVLVAGAAGAVVVAAGGDDSPGRPQAQAVVLEPVGQATPDPFMEGSLDLGGADLINLGEPPALPEPAATSGATPGLYGGSQDARICDVQRQIDFLTDPANRDKAEAWAAVQGIEVDELAGYLGGLTPVRLRYDTRVTNHSFADGAARPVQSILQAGTAVLVDELGVPRSKCFCGNPLAPPVTSDDERIANPEDAWEGFEPAKVVTVQPSPEPIDDLDLADPGTAPSPPPQDPSPPPPPTDDDEGALRACTPEMLAEAEAGGISPEELEARGICDPG